MGDIRSMQDGALFTFLDVRDQQTAEPAAFILEAVARPREPCRPIKTWRQHSLDLVSRADADSPLPLGSSWNAIIYQMPSQGDSAGNHVMT